MRSDVRNDETLGGGMMPGVATRPRDAATAPTLPERVIAGHAGGADHLDDRYTSTPPVRTTGRSRRWWRPVLWTLGTIVATLALRTALPELREGVAVLDDAHAGVLVGAVVIEIAALATLPLTFRAALALLGGRARYGVALDGTLGAFALSRVVPGGGLAGGVYAARRFTRAGNTVAISSAAVGVAGTATMLTLVTVVAAGAAVEAVRGSGPVGLVWSLGLLLAVVGVCGAAAFRMLRDPGRLRTFCHRIARVARRPEQADLWREHAAGLMAALAHPRRVTGIVGWATLNWALQLLALWTTFAAFGVSMPVGVLVLGFGAANLVTALPHTPGGLGVVEVGMTTTYVAMGVPMSTALVGVVCYRLLGHWLPVVAALPLVLPQLRAHGRGR